MGVQFGYGQGSANSANQNLGRDSSPRRSCLLEVSAAHPNGLAKVAPSLLIERAGAGARTTVARRKVPAKQKVKTLLQPRVLLEKFRLFTVQLPHFAGEKIARIANRVRAIALSLLQLRVLRLGLFQDGDVGVGVFPDGEEVLVGSLAFSESPCSA